VLSEEAKNPSRTIPAATYTAVAAAALLYAAAARATAVHAGRSHVVAAATAQGPGCCTASPQAAPWPRQPSCCS
jgi:amino acid transporter